MITWIFKKRESNQSGLTCSVLSVYGIKYPKMLELIGEPHLLVGKDNEEKPMKSIWIFSLFNGEKVKLEYDRDETSLRKLERENLKSVQRGPMESCDFLEIMGNTNSTVIFATLLKSLFPKASFDGRREIGDHHYAVRKIFEI